MDKNQNSDALLEILEDIEIAISEDESLEEEIVEELQTMMEEIKKNPTKENIEVLSKVLSSISKASLAESILSFSDMN